MHHSPLQMLNVYLLNQKREATFVITFFYEPQSQYIANQSRSAKETVSPKIGENIEMSVCFICVKTQGRTLIDINHYQITINQ